ncbi:MAG: hypothetical protein LUQ65_08665 [Candidatus Helarchaeota archaeon]|nr:hypothetical protein [Candidatus Helarchaeota archaeon]
MSEACSVAVDEQSFHLLPDDRAIGLHYLLQRDNPQLEEKPIGIKLFLAPSIGSLS